MRDLQAHEVALVRELVEREVARLERLQDDDLLTDETAARLAEVSELERKIPLTYERVQVVQWRVLGDDDDSITTVPHGVEFDPVTHGWADQDDIDNAAVQYGEPGYVVITQLTDLYELRGGAA